MARPKKNQPNNFELFVKRKIQEVNQIALVEKFEDYMAHPNGEKVYMRIDYDILKFYRTYPHYQTAMKKALRTIMDAAKAGQKINLN